MVYHTDKTPQEYASLLIQLHFGHYNPAIKEAVSAARAYKDIPAQYFADVILEIIKRSIAAGNRYDR